MTPEDLILKLCGIEGTVEEYREKVKQEFRDYSALLLTMSDEEFALQVGEVFGGDIKQAAIIGILLARIQRLEKAHE